MLTPLTACRIALEFNYDFAVCPHDPKNRLCKDIPPFKGCGMCMEAQQ
jgi:hypothetical protein